MLKQTMQCKRAERAQRKFRDPFYFTNYLNRKFDELRVWFGGKCLFCDETQDLEFAHIKPTGLSGSSRGKKTRYYDIKRHPTSYRLMCKLHHRLFDAGALNLPEVVVA